MSRIHRILMRVREPRRLSRLGDILTAEEADRAYAIWCQDGGRFGRHVVHVIAAKVIEPVIGRIARDHGEGDAIYLAYLIAAVFDRHNGLTSSETLIEDGVL